MSKRSQVEDGVRRAIGDPNSIVGARIHTSQGDDHDETMTQWQTRAVMKVLENKELLKPEK